jgi:hypothetical protein
VVAGARIPNCARALAAHKRCRHTGYGISATFMLIRRFRVPRGNEAPPDLNLQLRAISIEAD